MSCHTVPLLLDSTCVSLQIASKTSPEEAPDAASGADTSGDDDGDDDHHDEADDADSSMAKTETPVFGAVCGDRDDDRAAASAQVSA